MSSDTAFSGVISAIEELTEIQESAPEITNEQYEAIDNAIEILKGAL